MGGAVSRGWAFYDQRWNLEGYREIVLVEPLHFNSESNYYTIPMGVIVKRADLRSQRIEGCILSGATNRRSAEMGRWKLEVCRKVL